MSIYQLLIKLRNEILLCMKLMKNSAGGRSNLICFQRKSICLDFFHFKIFFICHWYESWCLLFSILYYYYIFCQAMNHPPPPICFYSFYLFAPYSTWGQWLNMQRGRRSQTKKVNWNVISHSSAAQRGLVYLHVCVCVRVWSSFVILHVFVW